VNFFFFANSAGKFLKLAFLATISTNNRSINPLNITALDGRFEIYGFIEYVSYELEIVWKFGLRE
jgi:hypothetical protein